MKKTIASLQASPTLMLTCHASRSLSSRGRFPLSLPFDAGHAGYFDLKIMAHYWAGYSLSKTELVVSILTKKCVA